MNNKSFLKTSLLTGLALIAFAANSVLCRLALGNEAIDASSFTEIRLLSGAIALFIILSIKGSIKGSNKGASSKGSWTASFTLFLYAITFSYAYLSVDTGTGALILFGSVQITMIMLSLISGTRLHLIEWSGVFLAFTGLIYLILPNITTPSINGFILMTVSGISWGIYTLKGRGSKNPLMDTTYNFLRTIPFVTLLALFTMQNMSYSFEGIVLAIISGAITSGVGYTIWYVALGDLTSTQAAVIQLSVPVIAAIGGVIFVSELITIRLVISAIIVLSGILMVVLGKYYFTQKSAK
ncbi:DMT family transporter [Candidatus Colwellia aromaticivorans]|uniref:DMT family transporter n=1 Tax=Candidatus Colwellia aromaticivorans TaxID=2267621 RepID=UPI001B34BFB0|nr:DMT family transporter [Candidatus Colwellia aromaticivorans]